MMTRNRQILLVTVLALSALPATAAMVTVEDPSGGSDYTVTYDDTQTGLYGAPQLRNNTIFFLPSNFYAESLNGGGDALTHSTIQLTLNALTPGFSFDQFNVLERGDYLLNGPGAEVDVEGQITVFDPDDAFNYYSTFFGADAPTDINDNDLHSWTASANIDASSGWIAGSTEVQLTLENLLQASTEFAGTTAFIEKKFSGIAISVNRSPIPAPAALWLLGSAVIGMAGLRRESGN